MPHKTPLYLADRVALVTGGSSGIGFATARMLAAHGARVVLVARHADEVDAAARSIIGSGGQALAVMADVTDPAATKRMVNAAVDRFGRLDYAVNSAGRASFGAFLDLDVAEYDALMAVNARGVFLSMQAEIPEMLAGGGGAIVNVASTTGVFGAPNVAHYAASKHAVVGLTQSVALEFAKQNVRINVVAPSTTNTPMVARIAAPVLDALKTRLPIGRLAEPHEIAAGIVYLLVDATFATGTVLTLDGGKSAG